MVVLIVLGALLWGLGIFHTDRTAILNQPLPDDAYYYYSLARNAAQGRGWVVAGTQTPTTGFQPLWALILTGLWRVLDGASSGALISTAQGLALISGMATGVLVFSLVKRLTSHTAIACLAMGAFLFSPQIIRHHLNGMETFLTFLAVAGISLVLSASLGRDLERWQFAVCGLLSGVSILARADMVVWVAAAIAVFGLSRLRKHDGVSLRGVLVSGGALSVGFLVPLLPWWAYSAGLGQGLIPESGDAVRVLSLLHNHLPIESPIQALMRDPDFYLGYYVRNITRFTGAWGRQAPLLLPGAIPAYALLGARTADSVMTIAGAVLAFASLYAARRRRAVTLFYLLCFWWMACLGLTLAYAVAIQGQWFYHRYAASLGFVANLIFLLTLFHGLSCVRERALRFAGTASVVLAFSFALLVAEGSYRWLLEGPSAVPDDGFYRASQYLDSKLPVESRVGAFQGGLIGFYTQQSVLPLDGKVNAHAREALIDKSMFQYLCDEDIDYLVDLQEQIENLLIRRTRHWEPSNLNKLHTVGVEEYPDLVIYRINRERCTP